MAKQVCAVCELREQCTQSKDGRTIMRHLRQGELDELIAQASSAKSRGDLKRRQHLCEVSFANASRYGYKRARWRRLWRVAIENYLICAVQNIEKLVKHHAENRGAMSQTVMSWNALFISSYFGFIAKRNALLEVNLDHDN